MDAYRLVGEDGFLRRWTQSIPLPDKTQWRDPDMASTYALMGLASDPESYLRRPVEARIPLCYWPESLRLSHGERLWDPAAVRVPVLAIRGARDFWSRPEGLAFVKHAYVNAPRVDTLTIPDGTHLLFLDRPERGRTRFIQGVLSFLADE
ncbi:hypothetical protein [Frateuria sp. Soil773]|uniref:alpha/beta fold hydrolase n=1 Tax=Frateuria sp. Soil773 TaxID=1736407 RepID=UPI0012FBEB77|nr:hypothetical protein [Frateuria sp. Soil773]